MPPRGASLSVFFVCCLKLCAWASNCSLLSSNRWRLRGCCSSISLISARCCRPEFEQNGLGFAITRVYIDIGEPLSPRLTPVHAVAGRCMYLRMVRLGQNAPVVGRVQRSVVEMSVLLSLACGKEQHLCPVRSSSLLITHVRSPEENASLYWRKV